MMKKTYRNRNGLILKTVNFLIWLIFLFININNLNYFNIASFSRQFLMMIFMALGLSLEMLCGNLDLAFSAQISSSTVIAAYMINSGFQIWTACLVLFLFHFLIGILKAFLFAKLEIPSIIATLALSIILSNLVTFVSDSGSIIIQSTKNYYNTGSFWLYIFIAFLVMTGLLYVLLKKTYYGRYCRMMGENMNAVRESGLNYIPIMMIIHVIAACFFSIAAIVILFVTLSGSPSQGSNYLYKVIAAACLGGISFHNGKGEVHGMVIGTVTMIMIVSLLTRFGLLNIYENIIEGFIIIISLLSGRKFTSTEDTPTNSENGLIER